MAAAANDTCAVRLPSPTPSQRPRPLSTYAIAKAAVNGRSLMTRSGRIHAQLAGIRVSSSRVGVFCVAMAKRIKFEVCLDYQCPFVYRAAGLLEAVRRSGDRDFDIRWRYFSLTQVNSKDDGWTVWDAAASDKVRGRLAFHGAQSARRPGGLA